jgi:hypothetical protein
MASKKFAERIQGAANFLSTPTAQKSRGYLDPPLESALRVIDCFKHCQPQDAIEVAKLVKMHPNTVRQIINALRKGGYSLQFSQNNKLANNHD